MLPAINIAADKKYRRAWEGENHVHSNGSWRLRGWSVAQRGRERAGAGDDPVADRVRPSAGQHLCQSDAELLCARGDQTRCREDEIQGAIRRGLRRRDGQGRRYAGRRAVRHHRYRRLLFLFRAVEPAAACIPGHAAVRHHGPGDQSQGRTGGLQKSPLYERSVSEEIQTEAARADRRQRLQPRHQFRVEQNFRV